MKLPFQIHESTFLGAFGVMLVALVVVWVAAYAIKVIRRS